MEAKRKYKKTKIMIFEKGRHTKHDFILDNTILEIVDNFKYLEIQLYKNGNWFRTQKLSCPFKKGYA